MSKLTRIVARIFGSGAGVNQISQFGSLFAGSPAFTTDPAIAQSLSNWLTGWAGAAIDGNAPAIEDMNAAFFVLAYQVAYQMQAGIPEWNTDTIYYIGSLATNSAGAIYVSRTDANTGNLLSDATNWKLVGGDVLTTLGDLLYGGTNGALTRLGGSTSAVPAILTQTGTGSASAAPAWRAFQAPTVQKFLSGSGTYTTPTSPAPLYLRVRMVGGGTGGEAGNQTGEPTSGGASSFGTSLLNAGGGTNAGGGVLTGGTVSLGSGPVGLAIAGANGGQGHSNPTTSAATLAGCWGASSPLGGAGRPGSFNGSGGAATANSGSGGGGGGVSAVSIATGGGGAAGGFIDAIIASPSATYDYAVGAKGVGGTAGSGGNAGGDGGSGYIEVTEYYQ